MKKHLLTLAAAIILVATVAKTITIPAVAQTIRAALVRDIDNPARNAVQWPFYSNFFQTSANIYTVPAGKILVIEDVSFFTESTNAGTFGLETTVKGVAVTHWFSPVGYSQTGGISTGGSWFGGRTTRIYADPGSQVVPQSNGAVNPGEGVWSGYLIDANP